MNIYMLGPLAYETAVSLYNSDKERVDAELPGFFIKEFEDSWKVSVEKNTGTTYISEKYFHGGDITAATVKEGGIYAALWELCEKLSGRPKSVVGCEVRADDILIDQHVIEIMELFGENPYEVSSKGCYVIASGEESALCGREGPLKIGCITKDPARVIINKSGKRYLSPPERQRKDIADRKRSRRSDV